MRNLYRLAGVIVLLLAGAAIAPAQTCGDLPAAWGHVYNPQRLRILKPCVKVTGVTADATHGKRKQGCRSESDGDLHCWIHLDAGQEQDINAENVKNEGGNLVFEPMCQHRVTQRDALEACKGWTQKLALPPVGSHVAMTCSLVLDTQHGHNECHPVISIEVIPQEPNGQQYTAAERSAHPRQAR